MKLDPIFENVYSRLENELPYFLYYHSPEHTKSVIERSIFLAKNEGLSEKEIELIKKALDKHKGKRKYAAQELGISERTLYRKIKEYDIKG